MPNALENFFCGGLGGIFHVICGHPLDTVIVKLQTSSQFSGTWDCTKTTIKHDGPFGLYKGVSKFAPSFFGYGLGKQIFKTEKEDLQKLRTFGAGMYSGVLSTIIMSPFERIKCLLQIQAGGSEKKYKGVADTAVKLYKEGGIRSIYRGVIETRMRDVPAASCYFLTYNSISEMMSPPGAAPSLLVAIFAGRMAGIMNYTLKSRIQTAPDGAYPGRMKQVFGELVKKEARRKRFF